MNESLAHRTVGSIAEQQRFYVDMLNPATGERILDAGCGRGATLIVGLAQSPASSWHGAEYRALAVAACRRAAPDARLTTADLRWLPYREAAFDVLLSRDSLECVPKPLEAIVEMARVLKPGGRLLLCHWDWHSQRFNVGDVALARRLSDIFAETQQSWMEHIDPAMGRKLRGLVSRFKGLEVLQAGVVTLAETEWRDGAFGYEQSLAIDDLLTQRGNLSPSDSARWLSELEIARSSGSYRYSLNHHFVLARKALGA